MRDPICLHARLAVIDGLTHHPLPVDPATADTAVAARETCALRMLSSRQKGDPTCCLLHTKPSPGHRVREFVCTYRTLRDDQRSDRSTPTLA